MKKIKIKVKDKCICRCHSYNDKREPTKQIHCGFCRDGKFIQQIEI